MRSLCHSDLTCPQCQEIASLAKQTTESALGDPMQCVLSSFISSAFFSTHLYNLHLRNLLSTGVIRFMIYTANTYLGEKAEESDLLTHC